MRADARRFVTDATPAHRPQHIGNFLEQRCRLPLHQLLNELLAVLELALQLLNLDPLAVELALDDLQVNLAALELIPEWPQGLELLVPLGQEALEVFVSQT